MKNTSWSDVPFQVGEKATPIRPPSPSVVWLLGTLPTWVLPLPSLLILKTPNVSRSVTRAKVPSGAKEMSHGTSQPPETCAGVPGLLPPPQAWVSKVTVGLFGEVLPAASLATTCSTKCEPQATVIVLEVAGGVPVTESITELLLSTRMS